jgi:sulfoxide reductase heme-binding subunit YedZ
VLLIPLAATSNDWSLRRLGAARWRRLHRLAYPAAILAAIHFLWLVKAWPLEPFVYLGLVIALLSLRAFPKRANGPRNEKGAVPPPPLASS